jgi:hypothetical protein
VKRALLLAGALAVGALLPLLGDRLRANAPRCELDGVDVERAYRARVVTADGDEHVFCGVSCARLWLARTGTGASRVLVTDSATGTEIDAASAWFVRTVAGDGPDEIRVFAHAKDAERHVDTYRGEILSGPERPFGRLTHNRGHARDSHQ